MNNVQPRLPWALGANTGVGCAAVSGEARRDYVEPRMPEDGITRILTANGAGVDVTTQAQNVDPVGYPANLPSESIAPWRRTPEEAER